METEITRLLEELKNLKPGTEAYDAVRRELEAFSKMKKDEELVRLREMDIQKKSEDRNRAIESSEKKEKARVITDGSKAGLDVLKTLGIGFLSTGWIVAILKFEQTGAITSKALQVVLKAIKF